MSEIADSIHAKCLAFGDRIIKLNDYLLEQAANKKPGYKMVNGKRVYNKSIPVHLHSVSALCNQLLRAGTSIGANNAEACNAISKEDFKSKSFIALKEARESLYWLDLLHRNDYLTEKRKNRKIEEQIGDLERSSFFPLPSSIEDIFPLPSSIKLPQPSLIRPCTIFFDEKSFSLKFY